MLSVPIQPFGVLTSRTVVLAQENIDTDQIIPARFLTTTTDVHLGAHAFHDWRYDANGKQADHVLNRIDPAAHQILVAGHNFACGSSREHAPWALSEFGFRAVVSTRIADIFSQNAIQNGLLPVIVDRDTWKRLAAHPGEQVTIDLDRQELRFGDHATHFDIEPFARRCLLDGVDTLGWLRNQLPAIEDFERRLDL